MKSGWIAIVLLTATVAAPGLVHGKQRVKRACADHASSVSPDEVWHNMFSIGAPAPTPNGCSPPVYQYGRYIGQDPDPNIRFQLLRDPATGDPQLYP